MASLAKSFWKIHLSKPRHRAICARCGKAMGLPHGGECRFDVDHSNDGQYDYGCDDCSKQNQE